MFDHSMNWSAQGKIALFGQRTRMFLQPFSESATMAVGVFPVLCSLKHPAVFLDFKN